MIDYLKLIANDSLLRETMDSYFDFIIEEVSSEELGFYTKKKYTIFATDGLGNTYGFIGKQCPSSPIGYVDSFGYSGIIANNLTELFVLLVSHPYYWFDIIDFYKVNSCVNIDKYIKELEASITTNLPSLAAVKSKVAEILNIKINKNSYQEMLNLLAKTKFKAYHIKTKEAFKSFV